jgi:hypothetical protein
LVLALIAAKGLRGLHRPEQKAINQKKINTIFFRGQPFSYEGLLFLFEIIISGL